MRPFLIRSVTDGHFKYQRPRHACSITEGCPGSSWIILEFHITSWIIISCPPKSFCIIKRSNLIIMDNFGSSWRNSDHLGSSGIILDHLDSSWIIFSHQRSHGSYRIISDHFGSSWIILTHMRTSESFWIIFNHLDELSCIILYRQ